MARNGLGELDLSWAKHLSSSKKLGKSPRQLAWELLFEVDNSMLYSNLIVPKALSISNLDPRDKALVTNLVYGTIRMRSFLDSAIACHLDRKIESVDQKALVTLRMGAYQLLILKTPVHAGVNEIVDLAKIVCGKSAASFVNAIMRRISENLDFQPQNIDEIYSHPEWIVNSFRDALKDEQIVIAQLTANNEPALPTLVAWPGRTEHEELIAEGAIHIPNSRNAFTFKGNPGEIPAVRERRAGVQDLGSQLVVETFVSTRPISSTPLRWLDLCAGPGGKAVYMETLLPNDELIANEPAAQRASLVKQVLKRSKVTSFDGRDIPLELGDFDRILIDAPCTGIGALRRRPEVRWRRQASDLRSLVQLQRELLSSASKRIRPGGLLGYATCSPHLAETKMQVRDFLKTNPDFARISVGEKADRDGDLQLWTYRDGTDCMFLSLLERRA